VLHQGDESAHFYQTTRRNNPENSRENLKSYFVMLGLSVIWFMRYLTTLRQLQKIYNVEYDNSMFIHGELESTGDKTLVFSSP
jgi:hypothetical protein